MIEGLKEALQYITGGLYQRQAGRIERIFHSSCSESDKGAFILRTY